MIRRQFLKIATLASATGLASLGAVEALRDDTPSTATGDAQTVAWHVQGFTCVTCAVGLETLLQRQPGVVAVHATYPQNSVTIRYQPGLVTPENLRAAIAELGFRAVDASI
jgi:copper chaperone CopZ